MENMRGVLKEIKKEEYKMKRLERYFNGADVLIK